MNLFDFITQDELDDLPEDPRLAFATFVHHAQRRLAERTRQLDREGEEGWIQLQEARHGFMNVVTAAAKRFGIEPLTSTEIPRLKKFDDSDHRQFKADLDHYMTQLMIDNSARAKRESVHVDPKTKERIQNYLNRLKSCVGDANLTEAKKAALLRKLDEFEAELNKRRLNLLAVTLVSLELFALPGAVWASVEIAHKLTTNILQIVGEAKVAEDEARRLPPTAPPAALSPPRTEDPKLEKSSRSPLDDDIPF